MLSVGKGSVILYRLFDVSKEIDLTAVERMAKEGTKRLSMARHPFTRAIEFANPPVSFDLSSLEIDVFGRTVKAGVVAKAYDFGVLTVAFDITVPQGTTLAGIETASRKLDSDPSIDSIALGYATEVVMSLGEAVSEPHIKEGYVEDYMVFFFERLLPALSAEEFLRQYDPTRLLLYEERELSPSTRKETLKHLFSYYPDDFVVVHTDNSLVIEPSGSHDLPDLLEFANAQMVKLRYYDNKIDQELEWIYEELPRRKPMRFFRIREYENLTRRLTLTVTDVTEVTERVNNALKVTEDIYYARVYSAAMTLFRCGDWEASIREKLQIAMNTYKMLNDEISTKRGYAVEVGIFLLIIIDILLVIIGK